MQVGAEPQFLHGVSAVPDGTAILCSGNRLSGHRVQPSGLRPQPAFSGVELSHSPVSTTQWLTASTVSMSYRQGSEHCGLGTRAEDQKGEKPAMRKVLVLCLAICFVFALTALAFDDMRSEERRVGKECRSRCCSY